MDYISIHALRAEGDRADFVCVPRNFISIHALRAEGDDSLVDAGSCQTDFYPRPPCGGRRRPKSSFLCEEVFLSTPSVRRATGIVKVDASDYNISIHALRAEGDSGSTTSITCARNFYPRPPCGGRRRQQDILARNGEFLSTPSVRRATLDVLIMRQALPDFYPRPPCGGRLEPTGVRLNETNFYPRPPCGGRQYFEGNDYPCL